MTRLQVERSGGFAGLVRRAETDLDEPAAEAWRIALAGCPPARPRPDGYVYEVRLGDRIARVAEPAVPPDLRRLLAELLDS